MKINQYNLPEIKNSFQPQLSFDGKRNAPHKIERKWISPIRANLLSDHNVDYDHHLGQDLMDVFQIISHEKQGNYGTEYNYSSK